MSSVESIFSFNITARSGNLSAKSRKKSSPKLPVFDRAVNRKAKQISAYISRPPALRDWVVPIWMSSWSARGQIRQDIQALNTEWLNQETLAAICSFALLYVVYLYVFRRYVVLCVVFVSLFVCFFLISLAWLVEWPLEWQCLSVSRCFGLNWSINVYHTCCWATCRQQKEAENTTVTLFTNYHSFEVIFSGHLMNLCLILTLFLLCFWPPPTPEWDVWLFSC